MWKLASREEIPIAPSGVNTFGLKVLKEVWEDPETGKIKTFWKYGLPDFVQILAVTTDDRIIVGQEFQPGVEKEFLHNTGGNIKEGESPEEAARRELFEETGYRAKRMIPLVPGGLLADSGRSSRLFWPCLAIGCTFDTTAEVDGEVSKISLMTPGKWWEYLMKYLADEAQAPHGCSGSLKVTTLGYKYLGWLKLDPSIG